MAQSMCTIVLWLPNIPVDVSVSKININQKKKAYSEILIPNVIGGRRELFLFVTPNATVFSKGLKNHIFFSAGWFLT